MDSDKDKKSGLFAPLNRLLGKSTSYKGRDSGQPAPPRQGSAQPPQLTPQQAQARPLPSYGYTSPHASGPHASIARSPPQVPAPYAIGNTSARALNAPPAGTTTPPQTTPTHLPYQQPAFNSSLSMGLIHHQGTHHNLNQATANHINSYRMESRSKSREPLEVLQIPTYAAPTERRVSSSYRPVSDGDGEHGYESEDTPGRGSNGSMSGLNRSHQVNSLRRDAVYTPTSGRGSQSGLPITEEAEEWEVDNPQRHPKGQEARGHIDRMSEHSRQAPRSDRVSEPGSTGAAGHVSSPHQATKRPESGISARLAEEAPTSADTTGTSRVPLPPFKPNRPAYRRSYAGRYVVSALGDDDGVGRTYERVSTSKSGQLPDDLDLSEDALEAQWLASVRAKQLRAKQRLTSEAIMGFLPEDAWSAANSFHDGLAGSRKSFARYSGLSGGQGHPASYRHAAPDLYAPPGYGYGASQRHGAPVPKPRSGRTGSLLRPHPSHGAVPLPSRSVRNNTAPGFAVNPPSHGRPTASGRAPGSVSFKRRRQGSNPLDEAEAAEKAGAGSSGGRRSGRLSQQPSAGSSGRSSYSEQHRYSGHRQAGAGAPLNLPDLVITEETPSQDPASSTRSQLTPGSSHSPFAQLSQKKLSDGGSDKTDGTAQQGSKLDKQDGTTLGRRPEWKGPDAPAEQEKDTVLEPSFGGHTGPSITTLLRPGHTPLDLKIHVASPTTPEQVSALTAQQPSDSAQPGDAASPAPAVQAELGPQAAKEPTVPQIQTEAGSRLKGKPALDTRHIRINSMPDSPSGSAGSAASPRSHSVFGHAQRHPGGGAPPLRPAPSTRRGGALPVQLHNILRVEGGEAAATLMAQAASLRRFGAGDMPPTHHALPHSLRRVDSSTYQPHMSTLGPRPSARQSGLGTTFGTQASLRRNSSRVVKPAGPVKPGLGMGLKLAVRDSFVMGEWNTQGFIPRAPAAEDQGVYVPPGLQQVDPDDLHKVCELGRGQFGSVWLALWCGVEVALKELHESNLTDQQQQEIFSEAERLAALRHPCVIAFYGIVTTSPDCYATVVEFCRTGNLRSGLQHLKAKGPVSPSVKAAIALQAARGMEYLHSQGVVHFDLKGENLLCDLRDLARPVVKIGDLGLSKLKEGNAVKGKMLGTLPWMAPELFLGGGPRGRKGKGRKGGRKAAAKPERLPWENSPDGSAGPDSKGRGFKEPKAPWEDGSDHSEAHGADVDGSDDGWKGYDAESGSGSESEATVWEEEGREGEEEEELDDEHVTEAVDVYSFAIVLWEIWTLGETPYKNIPPFELTEGLKQGDLRPEIPDDCEPVWAKLMKDCWSSRPAKRPTFTQMCARLHTMMQRYAEAEARAAATAAAAAAESATAATSTTPGAQQPTYAPESVLSPASCVAAAEENDLAQALAAAQAAEVATDHTKRLPWAAQAAEGEAVPARGGHRQGRAYQEEGDGRVVRAHSLGRNSAAARAEARSSTMRTGLNRTSAWWDGASKEGDGRQGNDQPDHAHHNGHSSSDAEASDRLRELPPGAAGHLRLHLPGGEPPFPHHHVAHPPPLSPIPSTPANWSESLTPALTGSVSGMMSSGDGSIVDGRRVPAPWRGDSMLLNSTHAASTAAAAAAALAAMQAQSPLKPTVAQGGEDDPYITV